MNAREIRQSFLDFFARHGHRVVPSSSLVPADDPTLLFTNAGMNQLKDVFLGRERREYRRAASVQKCMRVSGKHNDLDNVGPSLRHHTFFEMLGNFSFGDYFKKEAIDFAWMVLTEVWKLPPDRLRASIFRGEGGVPRDDEAYDLWRRYLPAERIDEFGLDENFWQMGDTGPCGRCSEIHFDRRDLAQVPEGDRLIEVWNNVFMEFNRREDGSLEPLPAPSIDTGMGLERITAVIQGKFSNYDTDLFQPILQATGALAGLQYGQDETADISMRVIADHLRAMVFLIADGVTASNEWRGYVLRKIMRRAMRHGHRLGLRDPFLHGLVGVVVDEMGDVYPELSANRPTVEQVVRGEEERFDAVLTSALPRLEELIERASDSPTRSLPGGDVFRLYDSLGMPLDFIEDMASERQLTIDREGYERAMTQQRERARAGSAFDAKQDAVFTFGSASARQEIERTADRFEGYTTTEVRDARVIGLFDDRRAQVDTLAEGQPGFVVTDRTPMYLEAGGQLSDTGRLSGNNVDATVDAMVRIATGGPRAHHVKVSRGTLAVGDTVTLTVDVERRDATRRNHTATHLLHAALRRVLGSHVNQAGSLVAPDRLRFDFVHPAALTRDEMLRIEDLVNEHVLGNEIVRTEERDAAAAVAAGAMALFGEKYGDVVRVVSIGDFSMELCGGTHCARTGDVGLFGIAREYGVSAGVRRIEAITGLALLQKLRRQTQEQVALREVLKTASSTEGAEGSSLIDAVQRLQDDNKRLARDLQRVRLQAAMGTPAAREGDSVMLNGVTLVARQVSGLDRAELRSLADSLREGLQPGVVVLASDNDGKVALVVSVTKDLTGRVQAGKIVREIAPIVGGGGGGRPDFAEAGGKDPSRIADLLRESRVVVQRMLQGGGQEKS